MTVTTHPPGLRWGTVTARSLDEMRPIEVKESQRSALRRGESLCGGGVKPPRGGPLYHSRGTSLVESIISIAVSTGIITVILQVIYVCSANLWNQHNLYEGLICLMHGNSQSVCKRKVIQKIERHLPFGEIQHLTLKTRGEMYSATLQWSFNGRLFRRELKLSYADLYKKRQRIKRAFL